MGIYPDHGIAYLVETINGYITIVSTQESNTRLLDSKYYKNRQQHWFEMSNIHKLIYNPKLITASDFEVSLTDFEKVKLQNVLQQEHVKEHGWYEVGSIGTSYDWPL